MPTKPFWRSKTLIGALVFLLSLIIRMFGVEIADDDAQLTEIVSTTIDLIGLVLVVWGRLTAKATITADGIPPENPPK